MGNANSGRRPQPIALKVLRGNPGKRRLSESGPRPPAGRVLPPARLSKGARAVWDHLAPICRAMGTLTPADRCAFSTLCELQATLEAASAEKDGAEFELFRSFETNNGATIVTVAAAVRLERDTATALRPYFALFGLDPSSRARMTVPERPAAAPASKWAGLLK